MDNLIEIDLLGGIRARLAGTPIDEFPYDKVRALLALLAAEPKQIHRREWLASLLWPAHSTADGRRNLRIALVQLNKALLLPDGRSPFLADKNRLGFAPDSDVLVDVEFLRQAPAVCRDRSDAAALARALDSYRGPFLGDFALPDNPEFEEWLRPQRDTWRRRAIAIAETLRNYHLQYGPPAAAADYAERAVALDPANEANQRRLAEILSGAGCHGAAVAQLQSCENSLTELGVAPAPATLTLKTRLAQAPEEPARADRQSATDIQPVTVLHCELPLDGDAEPDEPGERLVSVRTQAEALLRQHGGYAVRHGADLVAYFGYPQASEHAALHAAQAGLGLLATLGRDGTALTISLHSGPILTAGAPDPAGLTARIGARLLRAAAPGQIVMSATTRALLGAFVRSEPVAPQDLGLDRPLELFRLLGENRAVDRFPAAPLTPLVGRSAELAQLESLWSEAIGGATRTVLIRGDAGVGKSRLLRAFCTGLVSGLASAPVTVRHAHCDPRHTATPLHPLVRLLEEMAEIAPDADQEAQRTALGRFLGQRAGLPPDALPLLSYLFDLTEADSDPMLRRPAQQLRRALEELLLQLLTTTPDTQPVLLTIEDLHWADPSTLSLIGRLLARDAGPPLLALFTTRPQFTPPWPQPPQLLELAPLDRRETLAMIDAVAGDRHFDLTTTERMIALSDGVPLYVEEVVRMLATSLPSTGIPANLHDLLAARLAAVAEARPLAQMAATIGREFTTELLAALLPDDTAIGDPLRQLCASDLIHPLEPGRYQFRHALLQEAAYRSQTRAARERAHRAIADLLRMRFPERVGQQPELLAHHLTGAGDAPAAVACWLQAAQHALARGANLEAIAHAEAGLALLGQLDPAARPGAELALRAEQGTALLALSGYGSQEAAEVFALADALLTRATEPVLRFRVLWGVWMGISSQRDFPTALVLGEELYELTRTLERPELWAAGHYVMGNSLFWLGRFAQAQAHFEQAVALDGQLDHRAAIMLLGEHPAATSLAFLTWVLWFRGDADAAVATYERALARARELGQPYGIGYALVFGTVLYRLQHDPQRVAAIAAELLALAQEHRLALWHAVGAMMLGWAQAWSGDPAGLDVIEQTLAGMRAAMPSVRVQFIVPLIEGYLAHGRHADALGLLDLCDQAAAELGDRHYLAELERLRGLCLAALGDAAGARDHFRRASALAGAQGADGLERRALQALAAQAPAELTDEERQRLALLEA